MRDCWRSPPRRTRRSPESSGLIATPARRPERAHVHSTALTSIRRLAVPDKAFRSCRADGVASIGATPGRSRSSLPGCHVAGALPHRTGRSSRRNAMLRPQDSATRSASRSTGCGGSRWTPTPAARLYPGSAALPVPGDGCPGQLQRHRDRFRVRDYVGDVWYQTTVRVPRGWAGQRIVVHFESATHRATVWVNDAEVVSHEGGYTPFEADVSAHLVPGSRPDHGRRQQHAQLPVHPARRHRRDPGRQAQRYWHDFFNYAGSTAPCGCTPRRTRT